MNGIRKRQLRLAAAACPAVLAAALLAAPAAAQSADVAERLDGLLAELAEPDRDDWQRLEAEILRLWSRSGSEAMDLLFRRGTDAMEEGDYVAAVEHLTALVDHAPDFAEGWNARATAFFLLEEYALAIADIERVLELNPRHFGALSGLAVMLERLGDDRLALEAQRAAGELHPNRPEVARSIERLERKLGGHAL